MTGGLGWCACAAGSRLLGGKEGVASKVETNGGARGGRLLWEGGGGGSYWNEGDSEGGNDPLEFVIAAAICTMFPC